MASFKKTTYLLLFLFFVGFFFSLYAETQRVRGKRSRGNRTELRTDSLAADSLKNDSLTVDSLGLDSIGADSLALDTTPKKEPLDAPVITATFPVIFKLFSFYTVSFRKSCILTRSSMVETVQIFASAFTFFNKVLRVCPGPISTKYSTPSASIVLMLCSHFTGE
mgnify:CR=1 FL=1